MFGRESLQMECLNFDKAIVLDKRIKELGLLPYWDSKDGYGTGRIFWPVTENFQAGVRKIIKNREIKKYVIRTRSLDNFLTHGTKTKSKTSPPPLIQSALDTLAREAASSDPDEALRILLEACESLRPPIRDPCPWSLLKRILDYFSFLPGVKQVLIYTQLDPKTRTLDDGILYLNENEFVYHSVHRGRMHIHLTDSIVKIIRSRVDMMCKRRGAKQIYLLTNDKGKPFRTMSRLSEYLKKG
jgi:hypothetical protein